MKKTNKYIIGILLIFFILSINLLGVGVKEELINKSELIKENEYLKDCIYSLENENLIYQRKFETQCEIQEYLESELSTCVAMKRSYDRWLKNLKK